MKKYTSVIFILVFNLIAFTTVTGNNEHQLPPYKGSSEFESMKKLVGVWKGTGSIPNKDKKVTVEYSVTSNGSAVVETLFPGKPDEMVTIYHDRKGKLSMVHFCAFGNQPRMDLKEADDYKLVFSFSEINDIDPEKEVHMHALTIKRPSADNIIHEWTFYEEGKEKGVHTFNFTRKK